MHIKLNILVYRRVNVYIFLSVSLNILDIYQHLFVINFTIRIIYSMYYVKYFEILQDKIQNLKIAKNITTTIFKFTLDNF
jgi:hypothetical protein